MFFSNWPKCNQKQEKSLAIVFLWAAKHNNEKNNESCFFPAPVFVYNTEFAVLHKSDLWTRGWRKPMFWQHWHYKLLYNQDYLRVTITPSAVFPVPSPLWPKKLHPSYFKRKRFQQPAVPTSFREFYWVHIFLTTKCWPELSCHILKSHYDQIFTLLIF